MSDKKPEYLTGDTVIVRDFDNKRIATTVKYIRELSPETWVVATEYCGEWLSSRVSRDTQ